MLNKESNDSFSISSTPTTSDVTTTILEELNKNNKTYECYENATIYQSYVANSTFWIEGVLLIGVGLLGLCGNFLTLAVLGKSKRSTFNQLLIVLSICDSLLIIFFIMMSACTTGRSKTLNIINSNNRFRPEKNWITFLPAFVHAFMINRMKFQISINPLKRTSKHTSNMIGTLGIKTKLKIG